MTTAPKLIRELAVKCGVKYSAKDSCALGVPFYAFTDEELQSFALLLAAEPVDGEVESLRNLASVCYAGLVAECDLPDEWADVFLAASLGEDFNVEGLLPYIKHRPDSAEGEQPKAEGDDLAISLAQIAGAKFTLRGEQLPTDVIGVLRMAADALSAAPQPEPIPLGLSGTWLYAVDDALEDMELHGMHDERGYQVLKAMHKAATERTQPEQPARDGVDVQDLAARIVRSCASRGIEVLSQDVLDAVIDAIEVQPPQQADGGAVEPNP